MTIKAVAFDLDGVLIRGPCLSTYLKDRLQVESTQLAEFFEGVFMDALLGKADLKDIAGPYLDRWGWNGSFQDFIAAWFEFENHLDQRMLDCIAALRQKGYLCCLATNQEKYRAEYVSKQMHLEELFDHLFFSWSLGCLKVHSSFFEKIMKALHLDGPEFLFFDDCSYNVQSAQKVRWQGEVFTSPELFLRDIRRFLNLEL